VGAGFGGIAVAAELLRRGLDDVTLLEAAPQLGGTWHHNRYPGAACSVSCQRAAEKPEGGVPSPVRRPRP